MITRNKLYYPKSHIITNLHTIGNEWMLEDGTEYKGYYHTNAFAGVKGIGYQVEAPGLGQPKAPKGKYKSSGYGDLDKKK